MDQDMAQAATVTSAAEDSSADLWWMIPSAQHTMPAQDAG